MELKGNTSRKWHERVKWLFALSILRASITAGQNGTIFRDHDDCNDVDYQLEVLQQLGKGSQSFKYKTLSAATNGFSSKVLIGCGGFGSVYRGKLRLRGSQSHTSIAVKKISTTSHQGAREFLAEISIIGQVQHQNLVQLLGWCHEKGELLLVYDFMPNGSLDQHLYCKDEADALSCSQKLKIVTGVATALAYLHEELDRRVIHRDVKSSNVMLDNDFNARLGDFGLATLSDHDRAPPSTVLLEGTHGYLAPELGHTLKATEKTDVYSFGALVLEVATGKKPILSKEQQENHGVVLLLDWVWRLNADGRILEAANCRLENSCDSEEMVKMLKIGLLCSHPDPDERPSMRKVLDIWKESESTFPPLPDRKPAPTYVSYAMTNADSESDGDNSPSKQMQVRHPTNARMRSTSLQNRYASPKILMRPISLQLRSTLEATAAIRSTS